MTFSLRWKNEEDGGRVWNVYGYLPGDDRDDRPVAWITWVGGHVERPDEGWVAYVGVNYRTASKRLDGEYSLARAKQNVEYLLAPEYRTLRDVPEAVDEVL